MEQGQVNVAITIPYRNHWHKWRLVKQELKKNRYVEIWDELKVIYSARKWR